jgi:hypothetical protein
VTGPGTAGAAGVIEARRCAVTVGTGTRRGQKVSGSSGGAWGMDSGTCTP